MTAPTVATAVAPPLVSVLLPVRNEAQFVRACLESTLAGLDHAGIAAEVLVIDGDSSDETGAIIAEVARRDPRVKLLPNPGRTAPIALNIGIRHARGAVLIRIDGHAAYPTDYFTACLRTLEATGADNVGGYFDTRTRGDRAMARALVAATSLPIGVAAGFRTAAPSGRADTVPYGCFRRTAFVQFGMFDERLTRGQDYEFNRRMARLGGTIWRDDAIRIEYFQIDRLTTFLGKQLRRQGPAVAAMWCIAPWSFTMRHATPLLLVVGAMTLSLLALHHPAALVALIACAIAYEGAILASAVRCAQGIGNSAAALLPLVVPLFHGAYGIGILVGLVLMPFRLLHWRAWRRPWDGAASFHGTTSARECT